MNAFDEGSASEPVHFELSDDERTLLWQGLGQWGGPADLTDAMAVAMGFTSTAGFFEEEERLLAALKAKAALPPEDWRRILLATEIVFASAIVGAGSLWQTVTGLDDESTFRILRRLQQRFPASFW